ncbi:MAG: hypothetical protein ACI9N9_002539 [Enterobacterales bacterium]|jgi:hypothetical protein
MIEVFLVTMAFFGYEIGDTEKPVASVIESSDQQIIRAIDSFELQGLNTLEAHNADEWFV